MLSGKNKRYLQGLAGTMDAIVQVGKHGANESVLFSLNEALTARELVKVKVLKNCPDDLDVVAEKLVTSGRADLVQIIGRQVLLYRAHPQKPVIVLPE